MGGRAEWKEELQFQVHLNIPCCIRIRMKFMVCADHRLQCITPHFTRHTFPVYATQNVQMHLKSTVHREGWKEGGKKRMGEGREGRG